MLIKKIKLTNFRQFYDEVEISFDVSPEKNVTVIHAENGVGKTALLNAIKWGFFSKLTPNFRNPTNLVNDTAQLEGCNSCRVEIEFEDDDREFLLNRRYDKNTKKNILKIFEMKGSVWGPSMPEPELVINSMLPKEMGDYFFFQGEGSNAVDAGNNQGNLAKSIRDILGFRVAEQLEESLKKVISGARKEIAAQDNSGESDRLNKIIIRDESRLKVLDKTKSDADDLIPSLEKQLEETEEKLALINNQDLKTLRNEEKSAENNLHKMEREKVSIEKKKYQSISMFGWAVFGSDFADASLDFIDESQLKGKLPEPYNKTFIEDILSESRCICGETLKVGSDGYKRITAMLEKASNPQLLQRLTGIRAQIQDINTLNSVVGESVSNIITQYDNCDEQIQQLKLKLKNLNEKISAIPEEEIGKLQKVKQKLKNDLTNQIGMRGGAAAQIELLEEEIKSNTKQLLALASNNNLITALSEKEKFVEKLKVFLSDYLSKTERKIRLHVLTEVNKTLEKFSRHDFHIKVSKEDFRFFLKDKNDNNVGQGDGLNLLLNLTITAALINFAAGRKNIKDPILNSATVAPLIIDAPFGVLDTKYRKVVINELPKHANQVIFLVSSSQWTEDMDSEIRNSINKEYCLILEESSPQNEKELDKITVNGNEIITSRYDCDKDRTLIEEI